MHPGMIIKHNDQLLGFKVEHHSSNHRFFIRARNAPAASFRSDVRAPIPFR